MYGENFYLLLPLVCVVGILAILAGCEQSSSPAPENQARPASAPTSKPAGMTMTTMPAWRPTSMPATTCATTGPSTTQATSRPIDPLATPESAGRALLQLSQQKQVPSLGKIISLDHRAPARSRARPEAQPDPQTAHPGRIVGDHREHHARLRRCRPLHHQTPAQQARGTDHASDAAPESLWPLENGLRQPHPGALHRG